MTDWMIFGIWVGLVVGFCSGLAFSNFIIGGGIEAHKAVIAIWRGRAEGAEAKLKKIKEQFDGE